MAHARAAGDGRQELRSASAYVLAAVNGPTPVEEATNECREILEQAAGDRRTQALTLEALAQLQAMAGDPDAARSSYVSAQWMLEDLGLRVRLASASLASSRVEFLADDPEGAERELRRDYDALDAMGERYLLSTIAGLLAEAVCRQGRDDEAELLTEKAEAIASPNDVFSQALWRSVRAKLLARRGEHGAALRLAREAVELLEATDAVLQQADALADLAEVMRLAGRSSEGEAALRRAVGLSERKGNRVSATKARAALRELAAEAAGREATAARSRSHPSAR
jgi:tetratricopeptide (TPR) repeat protein